MIEPLAKKLKSRKFLLTLLVILLGVFNTTFELGLDQAAIASSAAAVAAFVLGESALDRERIRAEQQIRFQGLQAEAQQIVEGLQAELAQAQKFIQAVVAADEKPASPADRAEAVVAAVADGDGTA